MSKKHIIILLLILSLAIILRSIPVWTNYTWGADFGIYYGITSRLITNQQIYVPYDGWGGTYNYFPILYIVSAFSHWLTGMKLIWVMPRVAPIFGGFTVLIFYFIVYNLTKKRNLALLSSAFLAVAPFHVYQTSHAAPLTMGHFFMMLSLYLFIKYTMENKYPVLLMFSSTLLIMSHHLTTYFYAISLFSIIIFKSMQKNIKQLNRDITYFVTFSTMMFLYWALIATPVFRNIFKRGLPFHPVGTVMLFYALFFSALLLVYLIKKYRQNWVETLQKIIGYKRPFNHKIALTYFLVSIFTVFSLEIFFMTTPFPVSGIRMTTLGFFFSIPFVLFIGLGFMGLEYLRKTENNWFFQGYSIALTLSLCYALLTESHVFYPDRHIEYLVIPVSFFASLAVLTFYEKDVKIDFKF
ncbi:MAG TPA: hypothetical protein ENI51_09585, partial [Candidatus Atribacteria bacterium]|nr:hypothetical protein [Candidatus Atribacteria bacterium]